MTTKSSRHKMVDMKCQWCGIDFQARKQRVDKGMGRFCSRLCMNTWQKTTDAEATHGIEHGRKYWVKDHWHVYWREDNGIQGSTTYPHWWWKMNIGEVPEGFCVSYKDENKLNIDPSNFILISKYEATAKSGKKRLGIPQPWHGKEKSKWWTGGNSQEYPAEFSHSLRNRIKLEAKYICQFCNTEFPKEQLDVHHMDRDKTHNWDANLVTLCKSCHRAVHGKEKKINDMIRHLQSLLPA